MKTILVPIDFSDVTPLVLETAASFADAQQARLVLLHVIQPPLIANAYGIAPDEAGEQLGRERDRAGQTLNRHAEKFQARGLEVFTEIREGDCVSTVLEVAKEHAVDLLVIGSHGHGALYDLLVGSTAQGALRQANCPVLVVPPQIRNSRSREKLADPGLFPHLTMPEPRKSGASYELLTNVKRRAHRTPPRVGR